MRPRRPDRRRATARKIALWRYELIQPALLERRGARRRRAVARICRRPVALPTGERRRISRASVYRWVRAYEKKGGFLALEPRPRSDRGKTRAPLPTLVVEKALAFLVEDPEIPLPLLISVLSSDPLIAPLLAKTGATISRSTLRRRLAKTSYARLRRDRRRGRARRRWVPRRCHEVWHLDAKGPIRVKTTSGEEISFHVMSVIDGASRAVLAAMLVRSPDLAATVRVVRRAITTYGLPDRFYMDRGSPFDTPAFRGALALLGIHRIFTKGRNPPPNGKIEAYHRCLSLWFARRLAKQEIVDWVHVEQLFLAVIEHYQTHRNRETKAPPRELLAGAVSTRALPPGVVLDEAFLQPCGTLKAHRTTGEIDLAGGRGKYLVTPDLRDRRLEILVDPEPDRPVFARDPDTGRLVRLERARVHPKDADPAPPPRERWGRGLLQALYDNWRGKVRPVAEPGFGLTEVFALLERACGRHVPRTDGEAALVQRAYAAIGPFTRKAVEAALAAIQSELGHGRPVKTYLDALARRVVPGGRAAALGKRRRRSP
jgi:transposase InsO family protein